MRRALSLAVIAVLMLSAAYDEPYRPRFHFTPARNFMNDPNGLVCYEGEYHLFYQHNPQGNTWGHMSWGHAVSRDMVHWQHLPVALHEEGGIMIFSGSAVVDPNTSGFCTGKDCLVAIYTGHQKGLQTQNLAYSNDRGRTWTKHAGNPVLDLKMADFRDPKVIWHAPTRRWVMVVALPKEHKVAFFASPNLRDWTRLSDFGPQGAVGGIWECPDLFELPVEKTKEKRWVLVVNLNPGGPQGGSGTQYFVGQFDGARFTNENPADAILWADYGKDFYAAQSFFGLPNERRVWLAWMSNWQYANQVPTEPWRSAMTVPRELSLVRSRGGVRLRQVPIPELQRLRGPKLEVAGRGLAAVNQELRKLGNAYELDAEFPSGTRSVTLRLSDDGQRGPALVLDSPREHLTLERTAPGAVSFSPAFPGRFSAAVRGADHPVRLHLFVDESSVEVFTNDGETVFTNLTFARGPGRGPVIGIEDERHDSKAFQRLNVWPLRSAWR